MSLPIERSRYAIEAGYFGLLSLTGFFAPFALIFGIIALVHIKRNPQMLGKGRAVFGVVMGAIFTLLTLYLMGAALLEEW